MKLSKVQRETLEKMEEGKWYSAYELDVRITTLLSLAEKGLIERKKGELIWFGWERTSMSFRKIVKDETCPTEHCYECPKSETCGVVRT